MAAIYIYILYAVSSRSAISRLPISHLYTCTTHFLLTDFVYFLIQYSRSNVKFFVTFFSETIQMTATWYFVCGLS